jgi:two-component system, NtrC family, sensor kinase
MLADQREAAYETMNTIALKQGIDRIRIFNREGRVMFSTNRSDTGQVDKGSGSCAMCHSTRQPLVQVDVPSRARVYQAADGIRKLAMVTPIYNEPACSNAACHAHPARMKVLGVLDVALDLSQIDAEVSAVRQRVAVITGTLVVLMSAFIIFFTRHFVSAPINELIDATRAVSAMQLDRSISISSSEELGQLAASFDTMRVRLREALDENNRFTQGLESKVEERTEQLKIAHRKLLHSDRLASLGQLSASVAHEINNPISGILNLSMIMQRIMKEDGVPPDRIQDFRKYLGQVVHETTRVGRIVQDLLSFSRRSKPQQIQTNLNTIIATTVNLLFHKLKLMNVTVELALDGSAPMIHCDASQMQQVLINLIMNGAEAAQNRSNSKVRVRTAIDRASREMILEVADNGDGIPKENLSRIFDPFFTTKGEGKGVGLGLAVVYGIVAGHKGEIEVKSKVGEGTVFIVRLPLEAEAGQELPLPLAVGNPV